MAAGIGNKAFCNSGGSSSPLSLVLKEDLKGSSVDGGFKLIFVD